MKMKGTGFGSMKTGLIANRSVHPVGEGFGFLHFPPLGGRFHRIYCGFKASK